nr:transcription initiation factor TFIID subunit 8 isoform X2 [Ipomoea trifida]
MKTFEILSKNLKFDEGVPMVKSSKALKDVQPELEKLRQKSISKAFYVLQAMRMNLLNLQQRMVSNGLPVASSSEVRNDAENGMGDKESKHPFPAKTLLAGEKDLSPIALPAKFSAKVHSQIYWSNERWAFRNRKWHGESSSVQSCMFSVQTWLWNKSSARTATWFRRDEDKDDKKRRAELILRQSMENQQELTQL